MTRVWDFLRGSFNQKKGGLGGKLKRKKKGPETKEKKPNEKKSGLTRNCWSWANYPSIRAAISCRRNQCPKRAFEYEGA